MKVQVVPYSIEWQRLFEVEGNLLREHLHPWLIGGVHHIGSTAIPGLAAKPILDMIAGVRDLREARDAIPVLDTLGYQHADHRPQEALWFYKEEGHDHERRTHQLHLTEVGSALWRERLAFRDALSGDEALRAEYQTLKQRLAEQTDSLTDYTKGKRDFIARVLSRLGLTLE